MNTTAQNTGAQNTGAQNPGTLSKDRSRKSRILVVDDDPGIRSAVSSYLEDQDFEVETAVDARDLDRALARDHVDLIVLDVMLPGEDGLAICRRLAASGGPPVVMLSALGEDADRIVGLELGADDYLPKPCNPRELLARIRAVLRRAEMGQTGAGLICEFAGWRLDRLRRELRSEDDVLVNLTEGEFMLLLALVEQPQRILTRDQLLDGARGPDCEAYDRSIDVQISRIRRKLDRAAGGGSLIRTIRNLGYILDSPVTWR